ncbi:GNAT family N-acetyltransferase [Halomicrobium salinisoli]|uniref:GNAT family N-acetyltransferase n=1 Tax=Halomicrobium salinisoli TaxID=2878391 RepID=UPI001CF09B67|nr:GNAT family N-acetyltransferase [Halomicrobium salinisoli]
MATTEELTATAEWRAYYPVVADFWPVDGVADHVEALAELTERNYVAFGRRADEPVAFAGGYTLYSPWYGDFFWLVDLVTRPDRRGEGHGSRLYEHVESWAREEGCEAIVLASGTDRDRAHEFYEQRGFERTEHWFERELD